MTFKEMKSGYAVYLFDRNTMRYEEAKVMSIGMPRADLTVGNYGKMLVDITIQTADGKQNTYSVADTERTAYAGTLMLTTDKKCVVGEVKGIKAQAEEALAKVAEMQKQVECCKTLLEELDTAYREKQETENRFRKIEERFGAIGEKMDRMLNMIEGRLT